MYNPNYTGSFYDAYGSHEWDRLELTAYGRLQATIHADFIERYVNLGDRVLDAGCGPGRFTVIAARAGARVTALDLSAHQLELAEAKVEEAGLLNSIDGFVAADVTDLSAFPDGCFDVVVCYGGALSYVCEQRTEAAAELVRVVRPFGIVLVSVMSRYGHLANMVRRPSMEFIRDPERWKMWQITELGDLSGIPSTKVDHDHPPMHLYNSEELRKLLPGCRVLEVAGSNVTAVEGSLALEDVAGDQACWSTAVALERALNSQSGLVDSGSHIIMVAQKHEV